MATTNWVVVETNAQGDTGVAELLANEDAAQRHIVARIDDGVAAERLRLFAAAETQFGVAYQTIVTIGTNGSKASKANPAPAKDGSAAAKQIAAIATDAAAAEPEGTQDGVRFSSMFKAS